MKKDSLLAAIQVGQFLTLLAPIGNANKEFMKDLSRVRTATHNLAVVASFSSDPLAVQRAETRLSELAQALQSAMCTYLNVPALLSRSRGSSTFSFSAVSKEDPAVRREAHRYNGQRVLLQDALAISSGPVGLSPNTQPQRAALLHALSSVTRNSSWLDSLLALGVDVTDAVTEDARLVRRHSSHPGRQQLQANRLTLCPTFEDNKPAGRSHPRRKAPSVSAAGLFKLQVTLDNLAVLKHPEIAALAVASTPDGTELEGFKLAPLLSTATTSVVLNPGDAPEEVAQRILDDLIAGLHSRKAAIEKATKAAKAKAAEAAREEARKAVKQLDPKLLRLLKANPDLLNDA